MKLKDNDSTVCSWLQALLLNKQANAAGKCECDEPQGWASGRDLHHDALEKKCRVTLRPKAPELNLYQFQCWLKDSVYI